MRVVYTGGPAPVLCFSNRLVIPCRGVEPFANILEYCNQLDSSKMGRRGGQRQAGEDVGHPFPLSQRREGPVVDPGAVGAPSNHGSKTSGT